MLANFLNRGCQFPVKTLFLLFAADMLKDAATISRWLREGRIVLLDRYITSALAYQGAQGFPSAEGKKLVQLLAFPEPDVILYLDLPPAASLRRKQARDRFESRAAFLGRVRRIYRRLAGGRFLGRWVTVDAAQPRDMVFSAVLRAAGYEAAAGTVGWRPPRRALQR